MTERPTAPELTAPLFAASPASPADLDARYARLRAEAPVVWHDDPGIWVLSRYADVAAANKDTATFSSAGGILPLEIGIDYPSPPTMMHTDPPEHTRLRRAVAEGLRPSRVAALEPSVRSHVDRLVAALPGGSPFDVVEALAAPLPLMVICDLLGLPSSDWPLFWEWSDAVIPGAAEMTEARRAELHGALDALLRRHIATDVGLAGDLSAQGMEPEEIYILLNQLLIAGNETTRNLLSGGLLALAERPDQWAAVRDDPAVLPSAVEELLRWTTPVPSFMRTATRHVQVGDPQARGWLVRDGDPVLLLWASANRDEAEFGPDAAELDVRRSPNHHLAFGIGAHFCVGAALARLEARLVLQAVADRFERLEVVDRPVRSPSTVIAGWQAVTLAGQPASVAVG